MDDARLRELTLLAELEQTPMKYVGPFSGDTPDRLLAIHLLAEGFADPRPWSSLVLYSDMKPGLERARWAAIGDLVKGQQIGLAITHAGAVRRAELAQQLQTGRIREPMGLIWDGRHFKQDTRIALLEVASERPLVVAYLDLNGVGVFNERSHETGDAAIQRYLELVADITANHGDAYRLSGGADEVVVLMPRLALDRGLETVRMLLKALGRERIKGDSLRAAAGVVEVTAAEPVDALKNRADLEQKRAKAKSREIEGGPSVLAWPRDKLEVIPLPE